jgi:hypothetical protein
MPTAIQSLGPLVRTQLEWALVRLVEESQERRQAP